MTINTRDVWQQRVAAGVVRFLGNDLLPPWLAIAAEVNIKAMVEDFLRLELEAKVSV